MAGIVPAIHADRCEAEDPDQMMAAIERADRLIDWMAEYVGKMAPGKYDKCYQELNEHFMYMQRLGRGSGVQKDNRR